MNEDEAAEAMIRYEKNKDTTIDEVEFEPEAHYNHYGDRGVVDLVETHTEYQELDQRQVESLKEFGINRKRRINGKTVHLYEFKSDSAVDQATGANEIIRQFKRHCQYFFRDESRGIHPKTSSIRFELCFLASEKTWTHVKKNFELYRSVENIRPFTEGLDIRTGTQVAFRLPNEDNIMPVLVYQDLFPDSYASNPNYSHVTDAMGL